MRQLALAALLLTAVVLAGACGANNSDDETAVTAATGSVVRSTPTTVTAPTAPADPTTTPDSQLVEADYTFAVFAAEQPGPSEAFPQDTVYPGQSLRLNFTNTEGPENPCPSEADIQVTNATGTVVATATGYGVELPASGLEGALMITVRCERQNETGFGTWGPVRVLGLLDLALGADRVDAGASVEVVVRGGCADGSPATAELLFADGAALGTTTTLETDGSGTLDIPAQLIPQTLFVRAECTGGADPAIALVPLAIDSGLTSPTNPKPQSDPIEYQPDVFLSLFEPGECDSSLRPVMVTTNPGHALEFAERGYLGVVVEARNPGYTGRLDADMIYALESATNDLAIAVQWLRANADDYCIEPDAIAAMGHSFWGITALALAYSEGELVEGEVITLDELGGSATVGAPPPLEPPPDLAAYSNDIAATVSFSGFALTDKIETGEPPAILFHGRDDLTVPFALAERTCAAASAVGVTCELVPHDAGHGMADDIDVAWDIVAEFLEREMLAPAGLTAG